MRKMKDSGVPWIDEIPEGWGVVPLKHLFAVINGSTPKSDNPDYWDGDIVWITPAEISTNCSTITGSLRKITQFGLESCGATIVPVGSLILSTRAPIGLVALTGVPLCTNQGCKSLTPISNINSKFYYYFLYNQTETLNMMGNGTTFLELSSKSLSNFCSLHPKIEEQNSIAAYLDTQCARIDATIANIRSLIAKLKEYKQSVITEAVTKGLDPDVPMKDSGVPWMQKIPNNWTIRRLKKISPNICVGIVINPTQYISDTGLPYIYGGDIKEGFIDWEHSRRISSNDSAANAKTKLESGDILTIRVGYPGVSAVVPNECHGGNCASVMLTRKGNFCSNWLCYCMNSKVIKYQISLVKYGAAQEQFNISHAVEFIVPYPSPAEQQRIADYLDTQCAKIDTALARQEELLTKLEAYKKSLIYECVTGKREVPASA